jgi:uncharacterized protein (TIGR03435 family)
MGLGLGSEKITLPAAYHDCQDVMVNVRYPTQAKTRLEWGTMVLWKEQLGLKLQPEKGPVEYYVIDHVEKPSGN